MPRVAALAAKMTATTLDEDEPPRSTFSARLAKLLGGPDTTARCGWNPLREAIDDRRTHGVFQSALKLEFIRGLLAPRGAAAEVAAIESIEESPATSDAFRLMRAVSSGGVVRSRARIDTLLSPARPLSAEERARLTGWTHAPFPIPPFDPRAEARTQAQIELCLARSCEAAGVVPPRTNRATIPAIDGSPR